MWDETTECKFRINLSVEKKKLIEGIKSFFDIPRKGVCIIFDNNDYARLPSWKDRSACHMNVKRNGVEENSSSEMLMLMKSKKFSNLVWMSGRACKGTDIGFAWLLSHELRHLEQDRISNHLSRAGFFLYSSLRAIVIEEEKTTIAVPTELDAELKAWTVIRKLFGDSATDSFISDMQIAGEGNNSYRLLRTYDPEAPYNVVDSTVKILLKYKTQLESLQQTTNDIRIKKFNIEAACDALRKTL